MQADKYSPGGYLDPSESDHEGLITRLDEQLGIPRDHRGEGNVYGDEKGRDWMVRECLSIWWRPNFDTFLVSCSKLNVVLQAEVASTHIFPLM